MKRIILLCTGLLLLAALMFAGCTSQPLLPTGEQEPSATLPLGVELRLVSYSDGEEDLVMPIGDAPISATFGADGKLTGSSGCNRYTADYQASGSFLTIGPPASTRMACESLIMIQEDKYLSLLPLAVRYEMMTADTMTISDGTGNVLLVYKRSAA